MNTDENEQKHPGDYILEQGMSVKEAMNFFGVGKTTVWRWTSKQTKPLPFAWEKVRERQV